MAHLPDEQFAERLTQMQQGAQGLGAITQDINDGKYADMNELVGALQLMFQRG